MSLTGADLLARTSHEARSRVVRLQSERFEAAMAGVDPACAYVAHLERAIEQSRVEFATAAVTEIAALRGDLVGRHGG